MMTDDSARAAAFAGEDEDGISLLSADPSFVAAVPRLFEKVFDQYGFDFRHYSEGYLERRVARALADFKLENVAQLEARVLGDADGMMQLVEILTIRTTSLFRDAAFYRAVRSEIIPWLQTYPFIRIWVAGCSTGEEAYSLAILLHEEDLYSRCRIYATDFNEGNLARAQSGVFPFPLVAEYSKNYKAAGGTREFSDYYVHDGENAMMRSHLAERIVFAHHNLACDGSFNEFHVVFCRNVLIYFNRDLQSRVRDLIWKSLIPRGFFALGSGESLYLSSYQDRYEEVAEKKRIYRKIHAD
ncbi:chemotaxis protein methyltransferase CheR [Verrucomicrobium sp. GAS474]|uniref:CheR family methyltransferase n=1 Tax=Verrucomicrobium sp. GAS474 TaxID=1882831 RepID=UPI00087C2037|nr:CheR family methyltransferase [Verrucomicrobium sp. GAS474]SDU17724.1 chemotaxis protein methyltransferase CheR [Verrucomicrobium sp. GAS474]